MIFMFLLFVSAASAVGVMLVLEGLTLLLRRLGLLSLEPRLAVSLTAITAGFFLRFLFVRTWGYEPPAGDLERSAYYFSFGGGIAGFFVCWLIALAIAVRMKTREVRRPLASWVGVVMIGLFVVVCVMSQLAPGMIAKRDADRAARYQTALDAGDVETLRTLLADGYRANDLELAIQRQDIPMMELFLDPPTGKLKKGYLQISNVLATGNEQLLARFLEIVDDRQQVLDYGLRMAVIDGREADFDRLIKLGANANDQQGQSILMFASLHDRLALAKKLIAAGADVNATSTVKIAFGSTALIWAVGKGHLDMVQLLIDAGADVNLVNKNEDSALQFAVRGGSKELIELLLGRGADPNYQNRRQWNALHVAYYRQPPMPSVIEALIAAGADENALEHKGRKPAELLRRPLEGQPNFRDLGGYETADGRKIRRGLLFRSGELPRLTDADVATLEKLKVKTVVNFLTEKEIESHGNDRLPQGVAAVSLPIAGGDPTDGGMAAEILKARQKADFSKIPAELNPEIHRLIIQEADEQYAVLLRTLADGGKQPLVFHCSHGVHRTGTAAAIVLSALDVPWETVREDYLLSNIYRHEEIEKRLGQLRELAAKNQGIKVEDVDMTNINAFYVLQPEYIDASLEEIRKQHGSMEAYIRDGLGVEDEVVERLRATLLE